MTTPSLTLRRRLLLAALAAPGMMLVACGPQNNAPAAGGAGPSATAAPAEAGAADAPVTLQEIGLRGNGFSVGKTDLPPVYVFFDPQCGHCAKLWENLRELHGSAHFKWIPVAILNRASLMQGATLLGAADSVAAMNEHEASMLARRGGIPASSSVSDELKAKVESNTQLFSRLKAEGVPLMIGWHTSNSEIITRGGAMPAAEVAAAFGLGAQVGAQEAAQPAPQGAPEVAPTMEPTTTQAVRPAQ